MSVLSDKQLRKLIIISRGRIQQLMLTDQEADVLGHFESRKTFTSSEVTSIFGFAPNRTSMIMQHLFQKGYITRKRTTSPSGGSEYEFSPQQ